MTNAFVPNAYEHQCSCGWKLSTTLQDDDLFAGLVEGHKCLETWHKSVAYTIMMLGFFASVTFVLYFIYEIVR